MFGEGLVSNLIGMAAAVGISLCTGAWYGNSYGPNAWKLASIKAELAKTNSELTRLQAEDAVIAAQEWEQASRADAEFSKVAPGLKKCVLDSSQVEALNKLSGG